MARADSFLSVKTRAWHYIKRRRMGLVDINFSSLHKSLYQVETRTPNYLATSLMRTSSDYKRFVWRSWKLTQHIMPIWMHRFLLWAQLIHVVPYGVPYHYRNSNHSSPRHLTTHTQDVEWRYLQNRWLILIDCYLQVRLESRFLIHLCHRLGWQPHSHIVQFLDSFTNSRWVPLIHLNNLLICCMHKI